LAVKYDVNNVILVSLSVPTKMSWNIAHDYNIISEYENSGKINPSLIRTLSLSRSYSSWIYNYLCNQCISPPMLWVRIQLRRRILDTTLCDIRMLAAGRWFSPGTPISSTNKTDHHDIAEILLNVALITITLTQDRTLSL
jgi:hypothetical protein